MRKSKVKKMTVAVAEKIIAKAFRAADEPQFVNQMEWLLNGWPILNPTDAGSVWSIDGVP